MSAAAGLLLALASATCPAQPQGEQTGALDPQRALTADEAEELVKQAVALLDKRGDAARLLAAEALGRARHRAALPAFRFVLRDEAESCTLRVGAMRSMLRTGIATTLGEVIGLLRSGDANVRANAEELLCWQYPPGSAFGFGAGRSQEQNEQAIQRWEQWWATARDSFKLKPKGVWYLP